MQQYSLRIKSYRNFPKNDNPLSLSEIAKYRVDKVQTFKMLRAECVSVEISLITIKLLVILLHMNYLFYDAF